MVARQAAHDFSATDLLSGVSFSRQIHRVVPPPPPQDKDARWSLVYFIRPGFENPLRPLSEQSEIVREHAENDPTMRAMPKDQTAGSWFKRRVQNQRAANRKGPETWAASRGTERECFRFRAPYKQGELTAPTHRHARSSVTSMCLFQRARYAMQSVHSSAMPSLPDLARKQRAPLLACWRDSPVKYVVIESYK